jgi:hypothetical protein
VSRRVRRVRSAIAKQKIKKGKVPGLLKLGANPMDEAHVALVKEHGIASPLLYRVLLHLLREALEASIAKGDPLPADSRMYSVGGAAEDPSWRYAAFQHAQDMLTAKGLARQHGALGFIIGRPFVAPGEIDGYALILEHQAFVGILEMHHWAKGLGWRIYDGQVFKSETGPAIDWSQRAAEAP